MKIWSGILIVFGFVFGVGSLGMPDGGNLLIACSVLVGAGTVAMSISLLKSASVETNDKTVDK